MHLVLIRKSWNIPINCIYHWSNFFHGRNIYCKMVADFLRCPFSQKNVHKIFWIIKEGDITTHNTVDRPSKAFYQHKAWVQTFSNKSRQVQWETALTRTCTRHSTVNNTVWTTKSCHRILPVPANPNSSLPQRSQLATTITGIATLLRWVPTINMLRWLDNLRDDSWLNL